MTATETENTAPQATDEAVSDQENGQAPEAAPLPNPEDFGSQMAEIALLKAQKEYAVAQKIHSQLKAAGNTGQLLSEAIQASDDPEVVKARKAIDEHHARIEKLHAAIEAKVKPTLQVPTDEEVKALQTQLKEQVAMVNAANLMFVSEVKGAYPQLSVFDYTGPLPSGRVSSGSSATSGDGPKRPRLESVSVSFDGGKTYERVEAQVKTPKGVETKSTFSVLASELKKAKGIDVSAGTFAEEWLKQNNTDDWTKCPVDSTFHYTEGDVSIWVKVVRKLS